MRRSGCRQIYTFYTVVAVGMSLETREVDIRHHEFDDLHVFYDKERATDAWIESNAAVPLDALR